MSAPDSPPPNAASRRFQFTLLDLAEIVAGVGIAVALVVEFEVLGVALAFVALAILGSWLYIVAHRSPAEARTRVLSWVAVGFILLCCVGALLPAVSRATPGAYRSFCSNNLKLLALGLHIYHDDHGQFPPPYIADVNGQPMHSWRVLVLPYMEQQALYEAYDFSEPWNGPKNRLLANRIPEAFACPFAAPGTPGTTHYFYVTGAGRAGEGGLGLRFADVTDDHGRTILLVESDTLNANWLEPRDLTLDEALSGINARPGPSIGSEHVVTERPGREYGGANVAMVDASVRFVPEGLDRESLRALLTIDGGEPFDWDEVRPLPFDYAILWLPLVTLAYVVAVAWRHARVHRRYETFPSDRWPR